MIARASFEKSLPRLASAAPFLCLIELHLLCPDMRHLPHQVEETRVDTRVVGQLGMECRDDDPTLAQEDGLAVERGQYLDLRAGLGNTRRADEDAAQGPLVTRELEIGLEARDLPAVGVAAHLEIEQPEVVPVEEDHSRAGSEERPREGANRLLQAVEPDEPGNRRRLAARDHQSVELL